MDFREVGCDSGDWIAHEDRDHGGLMKGGNELPGSLKVSQLVY